jgi:hypothetical protein
MDVPHGSIGKGLSLTVLGALALFVVCVFGAMLPGAAFLDGAALLAFFGIGLAQAAYVVPLLLWARTRGETATAKGIWIAAAITFLLNAACFGVLLSGASMWG